MFLSDVIDCCNCIFFTHTLTHTCTWWNVSLQSHTHCIVLPLQTLLRHLCVNPTGHYLVFMVTIGSDVPATLNRRRKKKKRTSWPLFGLAGFTTGGGDYVRGSGFDIDNRGRPATLQHRGLKNIWWIHTVWIDGHWKVSFSALFFPSNVPAFFIFLLCQSMNLLNPAVIEFGFQLPQSAWLMCDGRGPRRWDLTWLDLSYVTEQRRAQASCRRCVVIVFPLEHKPFFFSSFFFFVSSADYLSHPGVWGHDLIKRCVSVCVCEIAEPEFLSPAANCPPCSVAQGQQQH